LTSTVNLLLALLPEASVPLQATVVSPIGKVLAEGGAQPTFGLRSTSSVAETE
jgi:hypothetical protein